MTKMKKITLFLVFIVFGFSYSQTNLLDSSTWSTGSGSVPGFSVFGTDNENVREFGVDHNGESKVLWKAVPDANNDADGGWNSSYIEINNVNDYRFTVWVKKSKSVDGSTLFGFYAFDINESQSSLNLDGTSKTSPYFYWDDLPTTNEWYLLVGYVHGNGHTGLNSFGGVYDTSGVKVGNLDDFKLSASTVWVTHRAYLYRDTDTTDSQFFVSPTLYEVNGQEPSIQELINPVSSSTSVWNTNGPDINYDAGKVGIGTSTIPTDYQLAVNGKVIATELKVQLQSQWPDYVFKDNYNLPTLKEVEKHIKEKRHLINIPSANEVEANGIQLGEMNKLLLEKIEELTLYLLKQEKRIKILENEIKKD